MKWFRIDIWNRFCYKIYIIKGISNKVKAGILDAVNNPLELLYFLFKQRI
jgi:hypothetical protein